MGKLRVFITSAQAIETMQTSLPHAVISIHTRSKEPAKLPNDRNRVAELFIAFDDCSFADREPRDPHASKPITKRDAHAIWGFFEAVKDNIDILVVQCEAGISRSAAVAAALFEGSDLDSKECYRPPRVPNPYVKLVMMRVRREMLGDRTDGNHERL